MNKLYIILYVMLTILFSILYIWISGDTVRSISFAIGSSAIILITIYMMRDKKEIKVEKQNEERENNV